MNASQPDSSQAATPAWHTGGGAQYTSEPFSGWPAPARAEQRQSRSATPSRSSRSSFSVAVHALAAEVVDRQALHDLVVPFAAGQGNE
jgi:hypothetical protein